MKGSDADQLAPVIPIKYWSKTGRHLFSFPLYYQTAQNGKPLPLDYVTLVSLASKELLLQQSRGGRNVAFMPKRYIFISGQHVAADDARHSRHVFRTDRVAFMRHGR